MPVVWALEEVRKALILADPSLGSAEAKELIFNRFRETAYKFRAGSSQIANQLDQPIPFAYYHICRTFLLACLVILSASGEYWNPRNFREPPAHPSHGRAVRVTLLRKEMQVRVRFRSPCLQYGMITMLDHNPIFCGALYFVVSGTMIGLEEVAVAMSDPFGDDDTDFDTDHMVSKAYNNAVAMLTPAGDY